MNHLVSALLVSALLSGPALAQQKADDHSAHHAATPATTASNSADMADGEVRRIDKEAGKLTLKHGELRRSYSICAHGTARRPNTTIAPSR